MKRREFLAAGISAPAIAALHGTSNALPRVEPVAQPTEPGTLYNVEMERRNGQLVEARIIGSDRVLARHRHFDERHEHNAGKAYRKVRFEPLARERRFLLVMSQWAVPLVYGDDGLATWSMSEADKAAYVDARDAFPEPASLLDVPQLEGSEEHTLPESQWLTRAEAFKEAADWNADEADERLNGDGICLYGMHWMVVVEIGQPILEPMLSLELDSGVGVMNASVHYPIRLVHPTDAERAAYPFAAVLAQFEPVA